MGWFSSSPDKKNEPYDVIPDVACPRCAHEYAKVIPPDFGGMYYAFCSRCGFGHSSGGSEAQLLRELHGKYYQHKNDREDAQLLAKQLVDLLKNAKA